MVCLSNGRVYVGDLSIMFLFFCMLWSCDVQKEPSNIPHRFSLLNVSVLDNTYQIEFACTPKEVALGLRYRDLQEDEGVILCVREGVVSMNRMKSPISVAFLSQEGLVLDIVSLSLDASDYELVRETHFVWEMTMGWFARTGIEKGTVVKGLKQRSQK
jgi:uncharacterized membrane protein (UPF0127 family)